MPYVSEIDFHFKKNNKEFRQAMLRPEIDFSPEDVLAAFPHNPKPLVVSIESLASHPLNLSEGGGALIARRLKVAFPDAHICFVVRNQFDAIESMALELLNGGGAGGLSVNRFMTMAKHLHFDLSYFRYSKLISFYQSLFGEDCVHVLLLEELGADQRKFIEDFLLPLGIQPPNTWDHSRVRERITPFGYAFLLVANLPRYGSLNPRGVVYGERLAKAISLGTHSLNRLYDRMPILGRSFTLLNRKNREFIRGYYKESNKSLARTVNKDLSEFGYPL